MAEIGTTPTTYRKFINEFRFAFRGSLPFVATYNNTHFSYTVVRAQGRPDNLYLTSITNAAGTKNLSDAEVCYAHGAVGEITKQRYVDSLQRNYVSNWDKDRFDVMLLCTVEAARSEWIYKKVNAMLATADRPEDPTNPRRPLNGDDLKEVAQSYGHTQKLISVTEFRALSATDYLSHYKHIESDGTTKATKFRELFIG